MNKATIRVATREDSSAILEVYAPYIPTPITFEEVLPTQDEFQTRVDNVQKMYPFIVAEIDGEVVGYAYASQFRVREAYRWNAELSVYLSPVAQGQGLGKKLYSTIIELAKLQGIKVVFGIVTSPNGVSKRLHDSLGFQLMARQKNAGFTCGEWHDISWYAKYLTDVFEDIPVSPKPFPEVLNNRESEVQEILAKVNS